MTGIEILEARYELSVQALEVPFKETGKVGIISPGLLTKELATEVKKNVLLSMLGLPLSIGRKRV